MTGLEPYFLLESIQKTGESLQATVRFPGSHPLYAGHFPGRPVVPGVSMLQLVKSLLPLIGGEDWMINGVSVIKYLQPVLPGDQFVYNLRLTWSAEGQDRLVADAELADGSKVLVKMKGIKAAKSMLR